ncbi:hypothetical protein D3C86_2077450 [compost metagenome]
MRVTRDDEDPGEYNGDDVVGIADEDRQHAGVKKHRQLELVLQVVMDQQALSRL